MLRALQITLYTLSFLIIFLHASLAKTPADEVPLVESNNLELLYSSEAIVWAKAYTPKMLQYENGDGLYPEGIYIEYYDKEAKIIATLRSNTGYQKANSEIWELRGDVEIKGYKNDEQQQLNTEELYWNLKTKEIFTDKFIRLETPYELLTGYGFRAMQDLTYFILSKPEGFLEVDTKKLE